MVKINSKIIYFIKKYGNIHRVPRAKSEFWTAGKRKKNQLKIISRLRGNRDLIVYSSDLTNKTQAPISIDYSDILPFKDQLNNLSGNSIDIIIETPGELLRW